MNAAAHTTTKVVVPYRTEPFGGIGWTTAAFTTLADAREWARGNRDAAMPCWQRSECWGGAPLGT